MDNIEKPSCIYCKSNKVIKHGQTSTGNKRYRCRNCSKTWVVEKNETLRPDLADITEAYLMGSTCRDLVSVYHSSPLRINQKIREFLNGCPDWEDYLDACLNIQEPKMIYLIGRNFSCSVNSSNNNQLYLALAIDALSTVVLGFEIGECESQEVWIKLISRMKSRKIVTPTFLTNGSKFVEEAIQSSSPESAIRITYHRVYRDKELACCMSRLPINIKLINEAVKSIETLKNKNLNKYLNNSHDSKLFDILRSSPERFSKRLKERIDNKPKIRVEGLTHAFQSRFEKFHMIKGDPYPVINGWIARFMLTALDIGFSRLSMYMQIPCDTSFKSYTCGNRPKVMQLKEDSPFLSAFVIEIAARGLQIPTSTFQCEMKLDKCSLF